MTFLARARSPASVVRRPRHRRSRPLPSCGRSVSLKREPSQANREGRARFADLWDRPPLGVNRPFDGDGPVAGVVVVVVLGGVVVAGVVAGGRRHVVDVAPVPIVVDGDADGAVVVVGVVVVVVVGW
jgi:hypothetical protein